MGTNIRVLVVEDDDLCREAVAMYLKSLGFVVSTARHGGEALAAIAASPPDVILLDLHMPEMDGAAFLRLYRGPIPVVVMSGWDERRALPRNVHARVNKPANMKQLAPLHPRHARLPRLRRGEVRE